MGLLNDVRFYLMIALAVLFLLVVAMCSSAYDTSPDGHATSGVMNESNMAEGSNAASGSDDSADAGKDEEAAEQAMEETSAEAATEETDAQKTEGEEAETQGLMAETETASGTDNAEQEGTTETAGSETAGSEEDTDATAMEEQSSDSEQMAESGTEADMAKESDMPDSESPGASAFELSALADSGEMLPDFATDLDNLKSDLGRYTGRLEEAKGLFGKMKEMVGQ